ncbi:BtrH N-terminal domain-containing protein [Amycolatopsis minnesotensis]|uniref:Butirosin biosynthesis protein H-like n=1 Tax=Amycolatopsis minnesotensis TaxID=337894 RepID=A0ABN2Q945_9PSEU
MYQLRGGRQPDVSALAHVLAHHGAEIGAEITEPLLFAASGGIGASYRLSEFTHDGSKPLRLGFRAHPREPLTWLKSTVDRLKLEADIETTGRAKTAARKLSAELDAGTPAIVLPDRYTAGYWHLPPSADGAGGHFVVAYRENGKVLLDDRNREPLPVERAVLDAARDRIGADKNVTLLVRSGEFGDLADAVRRGLEDCVKQKSDWAKWAKLLTDRKAGKGWPSVFRDRRGLVGALLSVAEAVDPAGMTGGHLRDLFADSLDEAAELLEIPELAEQATRWRAIGQRWLDLGDLALSGDNTEFAWLRDLSRTVANAVRDGKDAVENANELQRLRAHYDAEAPFTEEEAGRLFTDMAILLTDIHRAESESLTALSEVVAGARK